MRIELRHQFIEAVLSGQRFELRDGDLYATPPQQRPLHKKLEDLSSSAQQRLKESKLALQQKMKLILAEGDVTYNWGALPPPFPLASSQDIARALMNHMLRHVNRDWVYPNSPIYQEVLQDAVRRVPTQEDINALHEALFTVPGVTGTPQDLILECTIAHLRTYKVTSANSLTRLRSLTEGLMRLVIAELRDTSRLLTPHGKINIQKLVVEGCLVFCLKKMMPGTPRQEQMERYAVARGAISIIPVSDRNEFILKIIFDMLNASVGGQILRLPSYASVEAGGADSAPPYEPTPGEGGTEAPDLPQYTPRPPEGHSTAGTQSQAIFTAPGAGDAGLPPFRDAGQRPIPPRQGDPLGPSGSGPFFLPPPTDKELVSLMASMSAFLKNKPVGTASPRREPLPAPREAYPGPPEVYPGPHWPIPQDDRPGLRDDRPTPLEEQPGTQAERPGTPPPGTSGLPTPPPGTPQDSGAAAPAVEQQSEDTSWMAEGGAAGGAPADSPEREPGSSSGDEDTSWMADGGAVGGAAPDSPERVSGSSSDTEPLYGPEGNFNPRHPAVQSALDHVVLRFVELHPEWDFGTLRILATGMLENTPAPGDVPAEVLLSSLLENLE